MVYLGSHGCDKLFEEYGAAVHKQYNLGECTKAHLDSANYTAYHSETPADLAETPEEVAEIAAQDPDDVEILECASRSTSKSKNKRLFLSSSFFKSEHRIETILWLVQVSLIASTVMETLMQRAHQQVSCTCRTLRIAPSLRNPPASVQSTT